MFCFVFITYLLQVTTVYDNFIFIAIHFFFFKRELQKPQLGSLESTIWTVWFFNLQKLQYCSIPKPSHIDCFNQKTLQFLKKTWVMGLISFGYSIITLFTILSYWYYLAEVTLENLSKDQSSSEVRIYSGKIKIEDWKQN